MNIMVYISIALISFSALILIYALLVTRSDRQFTRLKDIYIREYRKESEHLEKKGRTRLITQAEYQQKSARLGRDLLMVTKNDRKVHWVFLILLALLGSAMIAGVTEYYWQYRYSDEQKKLDETTPILRSEIEQWMSTVDSNKLKEGALIYELGLPDSLQEQIPQMVFELNRMSAMKRHNDPKILYLLGGIYNGDDPVMVKIAYDIYLNLNRLIPDDLYIIKTLFSIEFKLTDYKLNESLERRIDSFIEQHPQEYEFIYGYAFLLLNADEKDKAVYYYSIILQNAPDDHPIKQELMRLYKIGENHANASSSSMPDEEIVPIAVDENGPKE